MVGTKTLDTKLTRIKSGDFHHSDFLIADAKDGDMGLGLAAPGPKRSQTGVMVGQFKSRADYLNHMMQMTASGLVDIMLMSASSLETLHDAGAFASTEVTPAVRLNDTTDIWASRGAEYRSKPSRPFRSANLKKLSALCDLGLYSVTFSNDLDHDYVTLSAYRAFLQELDGTGMRHFLEVFNPAYNIGLSDGVDLGLYINDMILKSVAGSLSSERPLFLKMQYNGPRAMEELASYDPQMLIVGILGGAKGTSRDTFELIAQAAKYGARVALFGRKINLAENQIEMVRHMRAVVEATLTPKEAVASYHNALTKAGLTPDRALASDQEITDPILKS